MKTDLRLIILTPEKKFYDEPVRSIRAPAENGLLGILPHHAPLLANLVDGDLTIKDVNGAITKLKVACGFLEVYKNVITVLTETAEIYNN